MKNKIFYILLLSMIIACKRHVLTPEKNLSTHESSNSICGKYVTKPPRELFYTQHIITLAADSIFTYGSKNCLGEDTSFGRWKYSDSEVFLMNTNKLDRLIAKQEPLSQLRYADLSKTKLHLHGKYLIWNLSDNWIDTLYRQ